MPIPYLQKRVLDFKLKQHEKRSTHHDLMDIRVTDTQLSSFLESALEYKKQKLIEMKHKKEMNTVRDYQAFLTSIHRIDKYQ